MKIVYILSVDMGKWGYTLENFLDTHFSVEIAIEMSRKGHDVELHTLWNKSFLIVYKGVKIYFYKPSLELIFKHAKSQFSFDLLFKNFGKDSLIHFHEPNLLFFMPFASIQKIHVIEHHGNGIENHFTYLSLMFFVYGFLRRTFLKKLLNKANKLVVYSKVAKNNFILKYDFDENSVIISPNGIQVSRYKDIDKNEARKKLGLPLNKKIILFVGRVSMHKGVVELIKSFKIAKAKCKSTLIMLGPMHDEKLSKLVQPYWKGFKNNKELQYWYAASDLFCLPSYEEPFGIVLIEAMYYNLPIVTTYAGGPKEFLTQSQVIFTKPKSIKSLTSGIITGLLNPDVVNYKGGRELVIKKYTWETICSNYIRVYNEIT